MFRFAQQPAIRQQLADHVVLEGVFAGFAHGRCFSFAWGYQGKQGLRGDVFQLRTRSRLPVAYIDFAGDSGGD